MYTPPLESNVSKKTEGPTTTPKQQKHTETLTHPTGTSNKPYATDEVTAKPCKTRKSFTNTHSLLIPLKVQLGTIVSTRRAARPNGFGCQLPGEETKSQTFQGSVFPVSLSHKAKTLKPSATPKRQSPVLCAHAFAYTHTHTKKKGAKAICTTL